METQEWIPAAQYLRMSTEHQQYSMENQSASIASYAANHRFAVIRTYSDAATSGLLFKNRPGLSRLLQDVISGANDYQAILVYDVSRWGRFQNLDEAAHYEFLCTRARVPVHYCAEPFFNNNSLPSSILKAMKRAMAAEYSRQLGDRVFFAEARWAQMGFKQGGPAGYALKRLMISSDGQSKQLIPRGEVKCAQSDRVLLIPGEREEVETVRQMFRLVAEAKMTPFAIAKELNRTGNRRGKPWSHQNVYRILTNPKYSGCNVWNRTTRRLGAPSANVSRERWVMQPNAFEAIVDPVLFQRVQDVLAQRNCCRSDEEIIQTLREIKNARGKLTSTILRRTPGAPSAALCVSRFGSLRRAFALVS